jgi:hypothetical protein
VEEEGDALPHKAAGRHSGSQDDWLGLCSEEKLILRELEVCGSCVDRRLASIDGILEYCENFLLIRRAFTNMSRIVTSFDPEVKQAIHLARQSPERRNESYRRKKQTKQKVHMAVVLGGPPGHRPPRSLNMGRKVADYLRYPTSDAPQPVVPWIENVSKTDLSVQ